MTELRYRVDGADVLVTLDELLGRPHGAFEPQRIADLLWPSQIETLRAMEAGGSATFGLRDGCAFDVECVGGVQIFCWVNSRSAVGGDAFYHVVAVDEGGVALAAHASSSPGWARLDIGIGSESSTSSTARRTLAATSWVEGDEAKTHPGLVAAVEKNRARGADAKASEATS